VNLRDYVRAARERHRLIGAGVLIGLVVGLGIFLTLPVRYSSETTLFLAVRGDGSPGHTYDAAQMVNEKVRTYLALIRGPQFTAAVAEDARVDPSVVERGLATAVPPETPIITVTATADSAAQAQAIARAVDDRFEELVDRLEGPAGVVAPEITQAPTLRPEPTSWGLGTFLAAGAGSGLLVGLALAVGVAANDRSVRSRQQLAELVIGPVLGVIPADRTTAVDPLSPRSPHGVARAEAYRVLRTSWDFVTGGLPFRPVILVLGSGRSEGRSTVVCELAAAMAATGRSVLLVDSDLRTESGVRTLTGVPRSPGLTGVVGTQASPDEAIERWALGRCDVLPSGRLPSRPADVLGSAAFGGLLDGLRKRYDAILLDSPPAATFADAGALAARADLVIVVARYGVTSMDELAAALGPLQSGPARIAGAVLMAVPSFRGALEDRPAGSSRDSTTAGWPRERARPAAAAGARADDHRPQP
jgi:capsular exopolysaccharide synthesis family protein